MKNLILLKYGIERRLQGLEQKLFVLEKSILYIEAVELTEIDLRPIKFKSIESNAFTCFDRLTSLSLSGCQLPALTAGMFERIGCPHLESLNLSNCCLTTIEPNAFRGMSKLQQLDIG